MDVKILLESMQNTLGENLPAILGALVILIVGWLLAFIVRAIVRKSLGLVHLNRGLQSSTGSQMDVEGGVAIGAYYVVLILTLIAFFNALQLQLVSQPLQSLVDQLFAYAPRLAAGGILILVAWILAMVLRKVATKALGTTRIDEKVSAAAGMRPISETVGTVLYWVVIFLFLPGILSSLNLQGLLEPIQGMVDRTLAMVPNLFAAVLIGLVGWFLAKLLRDLVTNLLSAAGADALGPRMGLQDRMTLSKLIGLVVYIFVFVPALIAALDASKIEAVSVPASEMLATFMSAIPNLVAAAVIILATYFVSGFVAELASSLLEGVGFDELPQRLGLHVAFPGGTTPSRLVGKLVIFFAMIFAIVEAANRLSFTQVADLVAKLIEFGGQVLLGGVIIMVGLWISNLAYQTVSGLSQPNSQLFAGLVRYGILGLVMAMGLRAMGIADDIVNLAFGLTLGAIAVAIALSFGLGGREAAGKQMEHWLSRIRGEH